MDLLYLSEEVGASALASAGVGCDVMTRAVVTSLTATYGNIGPAGQNQSGSALIFVKTIEEDSDSAVTIAKGQEDKPAVGGVIKNHLKDSRKAIRLP